MNNMRLCGLVTAFLLLCLIQERQRRVILIKYANTLSPDRRNFRVGALFHAVLLPATVLLGAPLPVIFLVLALPALMPYFDMPYTDLSIQLGKIIVFMAALLITFSLIRISGIDMVNPGQFLILRMLGICIAQLALIAAFWIFDLIYKDYHLPGVRDLTKQKYFLEFMIFCTVYCFADCLLCMLNNDHFFVPATLIFGNLLLLLLIFMFIYFSSRSSMQEQIATEYQQLESEKAKQIYRQQKLLSMAHTDALTGSYSRRYVLEQLDELDHDRIPYTIVYIDIDNMKQINDRQGHAAGDLYLKNFVAKLSSLLPDRTIFARMGGDEFLTIFINYPQDAVNRYMQKIVRDAVPFSFSYGISDSTVLNIDAIRQADTFMYQSKSDKKGVHRK